MTDAFLLESESHGYPGSMCQWGDPLARWSYFIMGVGPVSNRSSAAYRLFERNYPQKKRMKQTFYPWFSHEIYIKEHPGRQFRINFKPSQRVLIQRRLKGALEDKLYARYYPRGRNRPIGGPLGHFTACLMQFGHYMPREVWD